MVDHVSIGVSDLKRSRQFYDAALGPIGLVRTLNFERGSDWGAAAGQAGGVEFTITVEMGSGAPPGMHLCFRAHSRAAVREFYEAAIANGGRDDGAPGLRPAYHADYYGAFVVDPDGYRIEAVCHAPSVAVVSI